MLPGAIVNLDDLTKIDHMKRAIGMPDNQRKSLPTNALHAIADLANQPE